MPRTARSRYTLATLLWAVVVALTALEEGGQYLSLLRALAVTATVCAAVVERDEHVQQTIRLAWWAGTTADVPPRIPRQEAARRSADTFSDLT